MSEIKKPGLIVTFIIFISCVVYYFFSLNSEGPVGSKEINKGREMVFDQFKYNCQNASRKNNYQQTRVYSGSILSSNLQEISPITLEDYLDRKEDLRLGGARQVIPIYGEHSETHDVGTNWEEWIYEFENEIFKFDCKTIVKFQNGFPMNLNSEFQLSRTSK